MPIQAKFYTFENEKDMYPISSAVQLKEFPDDAKLGNFLYRFTKEMGSGNIPSAYDQIRRYPEDYLGLVDTAEKLMGQHKVESVACVVEHGSYYIYLRVTKADTHHPELLAITQRSISDEKETVLVNFGLTKNENVFCFVIQEAI